MLRPDLFGGLASHAGDGLYEGCYVKGFMDSARALRDHYKGSYDVFWEDFAKRPPLSKPDCADQKPWPLDLCLSPMPDLTAGPTTAWVRRLVSLRH